MALQNNPYHIREYTDMVLIYGESGYNALEASRLYQERFPERRHPNNVTIQETVRRLHETGCVLPALHGGNAVGRGAVGRPGNVRNVRNEVRILEFINDDPTRSIRNVAQRLDISKSTVHRVIKSDGLYPYHYRKVQKLSDNDKRRRVLFCEDIIARVNENENFLDCILFTDESTFHRDETFNSHNNHIYAHENPNATTVSSHQHRFSINYWAGIINNNLIGPVEIPERVNAENYLNFLMNQLPELTANVPVNLQNVWYQHDGAPAHSANVVRNFLNEEFPDRWIGPGGTIAWPARSPDLTPLDYFLWGTLKDRIYKVEIEDEQHLRNLFQEALAIVTPDKVRAAKNDFLRRINLCIQNRGGHFENIR